MVTLKGEQFPDIDIKVPELHMLPYIAVHANTSKETEKIILVIQKVMSGESEEETIQYNDILAIDVNELTSTVRDDMGYSEPANIATDELLVFFEKWKEFLKVYEKEEIPGLRYRLCSRVNKI